MKTIQYFLKVAFSFLPIACFAQTSINFETSNGYKKIGVYDTWPESPFRTGKLQGNVAIIDNHLNQIDKDLGIAPNSSAHILALQRSRYGSNTFGARIDLNQTFELTPTPQYVHALVFKPVDGRVMLIGLGKRTERAGQSPETEQFWELSTTKVVAGKWCDAVFPIKGAGGVDIYSLVVVPDCESTHNLKADFAAFIDDIVINNSSTPRIVYGDYPVNYPEATHITRDDRFTNAISLTSPSDGEQTIIVNQQKNKLLYNSLLSQSFKAKAGETLIPAIGFNSTWMHGYVYLDKNCDGKFDTSISETGQPTTESDVVSYTYLNGKNSQGVRVGEDISLSFPTFTLPADMPNGFYRMRFKVDWNDIDAGGTTATANPLDQNGGIIADVRLNIHPDNVTVRNIGGLNGDVLTHDGHKFATLTVPFGQALTVSVEPAPQFKLSHIRVRHGYHLEADSLSHGTPQYFDEFYGAELFKNNRFTIPAEVIDGDVIIEPYFVNPAQLNAVDGKK